VPLVGRIAAGGPILAEHAIEDVFPLPSEGTLFLLKVAGDSMMNRSIFDRRVAETRLRRSAPGGLLMARRHETSVRSYRVAVRARSRTPAVAPTYMSRVTRTVAWPAMQETSAGSRCQPDRAVVQNTCRRLCQVQVPVPCSSRHPAAW
jgi:Peptidase S24-like